MKYLLALNFLILSQALMGQFVVNNIDYKNSSYPNEREISSPPKDREDSEMNFA